MDGMARHWAVIFPERRWATERLFHHDTLTLADPAGIAPDDEVLLVADDHVVALARAGKAGGDPVAQAGRASAGDGVVPGERVPSGDLVLTYVRRAFDAPVPAAGLALTD